MVASSLLGRGGVSRAGSGLKAVSIAMLALAMVLLALRGLPQGKVARLQVLTMGDAFDSRSMVPNGIEYIGDIPVDSIADAQLGMDWPAVEVAHAFCNKDTD